MTDVQKTQEQIELRCLYCCFPKESHISTKGEGGKSKCLVYAHVQATGQRRWICGSGSEA